MRKVLRRSGGAASAVVEGVADAAMGREWRVESSGWQVGVRGSVLGCDSRFGNREGVYTLGCFCEVSANTGLIFLRVKKCKKSAMERLKMKELNF